MASRELVAGGSPFVVAASQLSDRERTEAPRRMTTAMRLLLYSPTSRFEPGGAQAVVSRLAASLRSRGHGVVEAWSAPGPEPSEHEWVRPLEIDTGPSNLPSLRSTLAACDSLLRLSAGLAKRRPQVVNVHFLMGQTAYFLLLRRLFRYKTVLSAHGSDILRPSAPCQRYLPRILRNADAVTVVSEHLLERVLALPGVDPAKVHVIPNGVDYDFWSAQTRPAAEAGAAPKIVAVGRLETVKGFDVLLEALARVRQAAPAALLTLVGDGSIRPELERQAERLGLRDAVEFPGRLGREQVRELLAGATVFALPSRSEGMPLALLEAMACATPAVAARVGGVPEVLAPGSGLLVRPEDPDDLAAALTRVILDRDLATRLGESGQRRAQAFSSSSSDRAYEELFLRLVNE